jgi:hypothetical protein
VSLRQRLGRMGEDELRDLARQWLEPSDGGRGSRTGLDALVRCMTDPERVKARFEALPAAARRLLAWAARRSDCQFSLRDAAGGDCPADEAELESLAFALRKRGFLEEARDRNWVRFQEPVYRVLPGLSETLASLLLPSARTIEAQLTLAGHLAAARRGDVEARLQAMGARGVDAKDPASVLSWIREQGGAEALFDRIPVPGLRDVARRVLQEWGGLAELRQLRGRGEPEVDPAQLGEHLERLLLGTAFTGEAADLGLGLPAGTPVIFLDLVTPAALRVLPDRQPEPGTPPGDPVADLRGLRDFFDRHPVRSTRDGQVYRASLRRMAEAIGTAGALIDAEPVAAALLDFAARHDLVMAGEDGRLRPTARWDEFSSRPAADQAKAFLESALEDVRGSAGAFHHPRLRRGLLRLLSEPPRRSWRRVRGLALLATNRYLAGLDVRATRERFQRRYRYAAVPPLVTPAVLASEAAEFLIGPLARFGLIELAQDGDGAPWVRLSELGAVALGAAEAPSAAGDDRVLIVTSDFEIVMPREGLGQDLPRELARFARRTRSDATIHFRLSADSVQAAVAGGQSVESMVALLVRHARYEVPAAVLDSLRRWAAGVSRVGVRRGYVVQVGSVAELDRLLRVPEFAAIAGERLNETTIEAREDPSRPRVAAALRAAGFFLG